MATRVGGRAVTRVQLDGTDSISLWTRENKFIESIDLDIISREVVELMKENSFTEWLRKSDLSIGKHYTANSLYNFMLNKYDDYLLDCRKGLWK